MLRVVVLHHEDVPADLLQVGLVHPACGHPEAALVLAHGEVSIGKTPDTVKPFDMPQVLGGQDLLDGEGSRKEVPLLEFLPCPVHAFRKLVPLPELGLEVRVEDVVDDQAATGDGLKAPGHPLVKPLPVGLVVVPELQGEELDPLVGHIGQKHVGKSPNQVGVEGLERIEGKLIRTVPMS